MGLKKNKLPHHKILYQPADTDELKPTRIYGEPLEMLKKKLDKNEFDEPQNYPHKSRMIGLIDRRGENVQYPIPIYMYVPPKNCRNIPNDAVDEWYLSSSRTCLLPNMEYGKGKNAETVKLGNGLKEEDANIGTAFHCNFGLLTLSFIAKEEEAIRCYLYFNGQMTRFMPEDIKVVFPKIFNMERAENQQFIKKEKLIGEKINEMNKVLKDKYFDAFRDLYS